MVCLTDLGLFSNSFLNIGIDGYRIKRSDLRGQYNEYMNTLFSDSNVTWAITSSPYINKVTPRHRLSVTIYDFESFGRDSVSTGVLHGLGEFISTIEDIIDVFKYSYEFLLDTGKSSTAYRSVFLDEDYPVVLTDYMRLSQIKSLNFIQGPLMVELFDGMLGLGSSKSRIFPNSGIIYTFTLDEFIKTDVNTRKFELMNLIIMACKSSTHPVTSNDPKLIYALNLHEGYRNDDSVIVVGGGGKRVVWLDRIVNGVRYGMWVRDVESVLLFRDIHENQSDAGDDSEESVWRTTGTITKSSYSYATFSGMVRWKNNLLRDIPYLHGAFEYYARNDTNLGSSPRSIRGLDRSLSIDEGEINIKQYHDDIEFMRKLFPTFHVRYTQMFESLQPWKVHQSVEDWNVMLSYAMSLKLRFKEIRARLSSQIYGDGWIPEAENSRVRFVDPSTDIKWIPLAMFMNVHVAAQLYEKFYTSLDRDRTKVTEPDFLVHTHFFEYRDPYKVKVKRNIISEPLSRDVSPIENSMLRYYNSKVGERNDVMKMQFFGDHISEHETEEVSAHLRKLLVADASQKFDLEEMVTSQSSIKRLRTLLANIKKRGLLSIVVTDLFSNPDYEVNTASFVGTVDPVMYLDGQYTIVMSSEFWAEIVAERKRQMERAPDYKYGKYYDFAYSLIALEALIVTDRSACMNHDYIHVCHLRASKVSQLLYTLRQAQRKTNSDYRKPDFEHRGSEAGRSGPMSRTNSIGSQLGVHPITPEIDRTDNVSCRDGQETDDEDDHASTCAVNAISRANKRSYYKPTYPVFKEETNTDDRPSVKLPYDAHSITIPQVKILNNFWMQLTKFVPPAEANDLITRCSMSEIESLNTNFISIRDKVQYFASMKIPARVLLLPLSMQNEIKAAADKSRFVFRVDNGPVVIMYGFKLNRGNIVNAVKDSMCAFISNTNRCRYSRDKLSFDEKSDTLTDDQADRLRTQSSIIVVNNKNGYFSSRIQDAVYGQQSGVISFNGRSLKWKWSRKRNAMYMFHMLSRLMSYDTPSSTIVQE